MGSNNQMRAWVLHGVGDIRMEERAVPEPKENEVLVKVKACGICGSDIPRVFDTGAHKMPLVIGHEFSGVVEACGKDADKRWKGKRVGVFPLIPCGKCANCRARAFEMCMNYDYIGSRRDGAFAEYVCVPEGNLVPLPDSVSFEQAAMLEPMAVAVHAMKMTSGLQRATMRANARMASIVDSWFSGNDGQSEEGETRETVLISGAGTIGLLLAMFLEEKGENELLVLGNKDFQKEQIRLLGLSDDCFCDVRTQDVGSFIRARTNGEGCAACFECVGSDVSLRNCLDAAAFAGAVVTVGNPLGDMMLPRNCYWQILRRQLTIHGTWNSSFSYGGYFPEEELQDDRLDDWSYVLNRLVTGSVAPERLITHRLALPDLDKGLAIMHDKTESYCKIMVAG